MTKPNARKTAQLRLEHATLADGGRAHLVMVANSGKASAMAFVRNGARTEFTLASGLFEGKAIEAPAEALLPLMSSTPLEDYEFARLHVHSPHGGGMLLDKLHSLMMALDGAESGYGRRFASLRAPPPPDRILGLPYDSRDDRRPPPFPIEGPLIPAPRTAMPWRAPTVPFGLHGPGSGPVSRWLQEIADDFQPGHGLTLGPGAWSAEAVAFYAEPGTRGQWRRQAAALYPAFARTIVHDPDLRALVDAGKPFEGRLVDLLKLTVQDTRPDGGRAKVIDGITPAKVRRLRAYPEPLFESGADSYRHALRLLARLPLSNVPATPEGWRALQGWPALMVTDLDRFGIPLETALAGLPEMWPRADLFQGQDVEAVQVGLRDMAIRCANTLLRPAHPAPVPRTDFIVIAMGLLFGGDSLARMARRQRDWHADLTRMNPILDDGLSLHWPALFAPFRAGGIEVRCLTSSAELDAEGGRGEDAKGMAGLDHCVGGYARSCHEGLSHIASVTAASPEGGRVRIATAELAVDRGRFSIRQLRGRSNQAPAPEVLKAVDALVSALGDGSHPHDRYAAEIRESDDAPEVTTIDLPAVYEAWRPHLPAALRVSDPADFPDLLRERVRQFVELDEQETDSRLAQGGMAAG